jgi:hypothetical protein
MKKWEKGDSYFMANLNLNSWSIGKASNLTVEGDSERVKFSNGNSYKDS